MFKTFIITLILSIFISSCTGYKYRRTVNDDDIKYGNPRWISKVKIGDEVKCRMTENRSYLVGTINKIDSIGILLTTTEGEILFLKYPSISAFKIKDGHPLTIIGTINPDHLDGLEVGDKFSVNEINSSRYRKGILIELGKDGLTGKKGKRIFKVRYEKIGAIRFKENKKLTTVKNTLCFGLPPLILTIWINSAIGDFGEIEIF
ncbi:MAG: hypothetical protein GY816_21030 [Cytophagales bacterium]|nr:hypothetical protein [Cytophagales bacterium]